MQLQDGQVRLSLPKNFDADRVLADKGLDPKYAPFAEFMAGDVGNWRRIHKQKPDAYWPHDVTSFRAGVPKDVVAKITQALVPAVLEWRDGGKYRFGTVSKNSCRSFRFAEAYRDQPLRTRVLRSYSVWDRLRKHDRKRQAEMDRAVSAMPELHRRLCEMERLFTLSDDLPDHLDHPIASHMTTGENARHRWYVVDEYGRSHQTLVVCPTANRPWLLLSGKPTALAQCDVSGSQIILQFLYVMGLLSEGEADALADRRNGGREWRGVEHTGVLSGYSRADLIDICETLESLVTGEFSARLWREVNWLMAADGREAWTMEQVKEDRVSALFGHWRTFLNKPTGRALLRMCPAFVGQWMKRVKAMPPGELARKMQAVESGIMLHGAAKRLMAERPECRFGTLHDAILAEERHIGVAVEIIKAEWELAVGLAPPVKCQTLSKPTEGVRETAP